MGFGTNLQYMRKMNNSMTQDQLAEKMNVSRQTVSKWESNEAYPEMEKVIRLCELFGCTMDELIRSDLQQGHEAYSDLCVVTVPKFRMARYVMISPQPEDDVTAYLRQWAQTSGLLDYPGYQLDIIGWDFPYVTLEQQNLFGLRGYAAACILPEDFTPQGPAVHLTWQAETKYARITIRDPFQAAFSLIPNAYKEIQKYLDRKGIHHDGENSLSCFERIYEKEGVCHMDVYIAVNALTPVTPRRETQ